MDVDEPLKSAFEHFQAGNLHQAEQICKSIIESQPNNANVLHLLGIIRYELKDYDAAKKYIEKSLQLDPDEAFTYFNLANVFRDKKQFDNAITYYQKALHINPTLGDAYYNLGIIFEEKGQISEAIICYNKALQINPDDADTYNNLGVILQKDGQIDEAITSYEKALGINRNNAKVHYNLGSALHEKRQFDEAIVNYQRAIQLNPNFTDAYNNLGNSLKEKGLFDEAITCYKKTLEINSNRADTYYNLGIILEEKTLFDEAIVNYQRAIQLNPNFTDAYNNLGNSLKEKGLFDEAITCYKRALQINSNDAVTHWNLSLALLLTGNFKDGWKEYEWRLKVNDFPQRILSQPLWDGENITERTILLIAEQGFGDTIQFIRYASLVAQSGAKVIVCCLKELTSLVKNVEGVQYIINYGEKLPDYNFYCPLPSLPFIFGTTLESIPAKIPYIDVDATLVQQWREKLKNDNSKFKIGLVWVGREQRSCSLQTFSPLSHFKTITFYSLQKGEAAKQSKEIPQGMKFIDYTEEIHDFSDTAALIENLDLVISVDTAVAHLAGALSKPVWILLPFVPDWRWLLKREDSPWYPTARLFRQPSPGDWESVITRIFNVLQEKVASKSINFHT